MDSVKLYQEYEQKMQRRDLFKLLSIKFQVGRAIYPGSYIHISPSFYIPEVVYVDFDRQAKKFFAEGRFMSVIFQEKTYPEDPVVRYYGVNYNKLIPEPSESFDLLISQYAGFVYVPVIAYR